MLLQCRLNFYPRPPRGGRRDEDGAWPRHQRISIHALREEGDGELHDVLERAREFLSTPSARRATSVLAWYKGAQLYFYPRPPRGGRLFVGQLNIQHDKNFYPRPPRGGRLINDSDNMLTAKISIHALREEGDLSISHNCYLFTFISIHALREEGDHIFPLLLQHGRKFLSTPSARRATKRRCFGFWQSKNFYPRPPRGGRQRFSVV